MSAAAAVRPELSWRVASLGFAVMLVLLWEWSSRAELISPVFFPAPSAAWAALRRERGQRGAVAEAVSARCGTCSFGWLVASVLAVRARRGDRLVAPGARRAHADARVPAPRCRWSAVIPVSIAGVRAERDDGDLRHRVRHDLADAAGDRCTACRTCTRGSWRRRGCLRMSRLETIFKISLPAALPDIFAGMRISVTVALILSVVVRDRGRARGARALDPALGAHVPHAGAVRGRDPARRRGLSDRADGQRRRAAGVLHWKRRGA